jgi:hypothetical protein
VAAGGSALLNYTSPHNAYESAQLYPQVGGTKQPFGGGALHLVFSSDRHASAAPAVRKLVTDIR